MIKLDSMLLPEQKFSVDEATIQLRYKDLSSQKCSRL